MHVLGGASDRLCPGVLLLDGGAAGGRQGVGITRGCPGGRDSVKKFVLLSRTYTGYAVYQY